MLKKFATANDIEFDSKDFEIAKLTSKTKANQERPTKKKELIEKLLTYIDLECFFEEQVIVDIKEATNSERINMIVQTKELRKIEMFLKDIEFRKTFLNSVNYYTIQNLLKRYIK